MFMAVLYYTFPGEGVHVCQVSRLEHSLPPDTPRFPDTTLLLAQSCRDSLKHDPYRGGTGMNL